MPARETKQLLRAIEDFSDAYAGDEMFKAVLDQLGGVSSELEQIAGDQDQDTPGREAARLATEEREKPRALRDAAEPKDDKGEKPRTYAEAAERARERFPEREKTSARAEGSDAPGTAREAA